MPVCCTLPREHLQITSQLSAQDEETFGKIEWKVRIKIIISIFSPAWYCYPYWNGHVPWSWSHPWTWTTSFNFRTSAWSWSWSFSQKRCGCAPSWPWIPWFSWVKKYLQMYWSELIFSHYHPRPHHHRRLHGHRELQAGYVHGGHPYYRYYYWFFQCKDIKWNWKMKNKV